MVMMVMMMLIMMITCIKWLTETNAVSFIPIWGNHQRFSSLHVFNMSQEKPKNSKKKSLLIEIKA